MGFLGEEEGEELIGDASLGFLALGCLVYCVTASACQMSAAQIKCQVPSILYPGLEVRPKLDLLGTTLVSYRVQACDSGRRGALVMVKSKT